MPLNANGLVKLVEECGELCQVAAKKMALDDFDSWEHWDGGGDLKTRLEKEIADVLAACDVVMQNFDLSPLRIFARREQKIELFLYWHHGGTETTLPTATDSTAQGE